MAKKKRARRSVRHTAVVAKRRKTPRSGLKAPDPLLGVVKGAERRPAVEADVISVIWVP